MGSVSAMPGPAGGDGFAEYQRAVRRRTENADIRVEFDPATLMPPPKLAPGRPGSAPVPVLR